MQGNLVCAFPATVEYPPLPQDHGGPLKTTKCDAPMVVVSHSGGTNYNCPFEENLSINHQRQEHRMKSCGNLPRPFKCDQCANEYRHHSGLYQHRVIVHEQRRSHQCQVCRKTFTRRANLDGHMNLHNNKQPFKCEWCEAAYAFNSSLLKHKAGSCPRRFSNPN